MIQFLKLTDGVGVLILYLIYIFLLYAFLGGHAMLPPCACVV